jgi:hypothetical protein
MNSGLLKLKYPAWKSEYLSGRQAKAIKAL